MIGCQDGRVSVDDRVLVDDRVSVDGTKQALPTGYLHNKQLSNTVVLLH